MFTTLASMNHLAVAKWTGDRAGMPPPQHLYPGKSKGHADEDYAVRLSDKKSQGQRNNPGNHHRTMENPQYHTKPY